VSLQEQKWGTRRGKRSNTIIQTLLLPTHSAPKGGTATVRSLYQSGGKGVGEGDNLPLGNLWEISHDVFN